ncbi:hypothetical protein ILUMI_17723, partial [Ignelater luminosus]
MNMLLVLREYVGVFRAAERLWQERYPDCTPHSRNVFSCLAKRVRAEGAVQPHHNKGRQDSVRKLERGSQLL